MQHQFRRQSALAAHNTEIVLLEVPPDAEGRLFGVQLDVRRSSLPTLTAASYRALHRVEPDAHEASLFSADVSWSTLEGAATAAAAIAPTAATASSASLASSRTTIDVSEETRFVNVALERRSRTPSCAEASAVAMRASAPPSTTRRLSFSARQLAEATESSDVAVARGADERGVAAHTRALANEQSAERALAAATSTSTRFDVALRGASTRAANERFVMRSASHDALVKTLRASSVESATLIYGAQHVERDANAAAAPLDSAAAAATTRQTAAAISTAASTTLEASKSRLEAAASSAPATRLESAFHNETSSREFAIASGGTISEHIERADRDATSTASHTCAQTRLDTLTHSTPETRSSIAAIAIDLRRLARLAASNTADQILRDAPKLATQTAREFKDESRQSAEAFERPTCVDLAPVEIRLADRVAETPLKLHTAAATLEDAQFADSLHASADREQSTERHLIAQTRESTSSSAREIAATAATSLHFEVTRIDATTMHGDASFDAIVTRLEQLGAALTTHAIADATTSADFELVRAVMREICELSARMALSAADERRFNVAAATIEHVLERLGDSSANAAQTLPLSTTTTTTSERLREFGDETSNMSVALARLSRSNAPTALDVAAALTPLPSAVAHQTAAASDERASVETALVGDQHDRSRSQSAERAFRCRSKSRVELRVAAAAAPLSVDEAQISENMQKRRDAHDAAVAETLADRLSTSIVGVQRSLTAPALDSAAQKSLAAVAAALPLVAQQTPPQVALASVEILAADTSNATYRRLVKMPSADFTIEEMERTLSSVRKVEEWLAAESAAAVIVAESEAAPLHASENFAESTARDVAAIDKPASGVATAERAPEATDRRRHSDSGFREASFSRASDEQHASGAIRDAAAALISIVARVSETPTADDEITISLSEAEARLHQPNEQIASSEATGELATVPQTVAAAATQQVATRGESPLPLRTRAAANVEQLADISLKRVGREPQSSAASTSVRSTQNAADVQPLHANAAGDEHAKADAELRAAADETETSASQKLASPQLEAIERQLRAAENTSVAVDNSLHANLQQREAAAQHALVGTHDENARHTTREATTRNTSLDHQTQVVDNHEVTSASLSTLIVQPIALSTAAATEKQVAYDGTIEAPTLEASALEKSQLDHTQKQPKIASANRNFTIAADTQIDVEMAATDEQRGTKTAAQTRPAIVAATATADALQLGNATADLAVDLQRLARPHSSGDDNAIADAELRALSATETSAGQTLASPQLEAIKRQLRAAENTSVAVDDSLHANLQQREAAAQHALVGTHDENARHTTRESTTRSTSLDHQTQVVDNHAATSVSLSTPVVQPIELPIALSTAAAVEKQTAFEGTIEAPTLEKPHLDFTQRQPQIASANRDFTIAADAQIDVEMAATDEQRGTKTAAQTRPAIVAATATTDAFELGNATANLAVDLQRLARPHSSGVEHETSAEHAIFSSPHVADILRTCASSIETRESSEHFDRGGEPKAQVAHVTREARSIDGVALRSRSMSIAEAAASTIELRASHGDRDQRIERLERSPSFESTRRTCAESTETSISLLHSTAIIEADESATFECTTRRAPLAERRSIAAAGDIHASFGVQLEATAADERTQRECAIVRVGAPSAADLSIANAEALAVEYHDAHDFAPFTSQPTPAQAAALGRFREFGDETSTNDVSIQRLVAPIVASSSDSTLAEKPQIVANTLRTAASANEELEVAATLQQDAARDETSATTRTSRSTSVELSANAAGDVHIEAGEREFTSTRAVDAHERSVERRFRCRSKSSVETTTRAASLETTHLIAHTSPLDAAAAGDAAVDWRQRPTAAAATTQTATAAVAAITPPTLASDSPMPPPLSTIAIALDAQSRSGSGGVQQREIVDQLAQLHATTLVGDGDEPSEATSATSMRTCSASLSRTASIERVRGVVKSASAAEVRASAVASSAAAAALDDDEDDDALRRRNIEIRRARSDANVPATCRTLEERERYDRVDEYDQRRRPASPSTTTILHYEETISDEQTSAALPTPSAAAASSLAAHAPGDAQTRVDAKIEARNDESPIVVGRRSEATTADEQRKFTIEQTQAADAMLSAVSTQTLAADQTLDSPAIVSAETPLLAAAGDTKAAANVELHRLTRPPAAAHAQSYEREAAIVAGLLTTRAAGDSTLRETIALCADGDRQALAETIRSALVESNATHATRATPQLLVASVERALAARNILSSDEAARVIRAASEERAEARMRESSQATSTLQHEIRLVDGEEATTTLRAATSAAPQFELRAAVAGDARASVNAPLEAQSATAIVETRAAAVADNNRSRESRSFGADRTQHDEHLARLEVADATETTRADIERVALAKRVRQFGFEISELIVVLERLRRAPSVAELERQLPLAARLRDVLEARAIGDVQTARDERLVRLFDESALAEFVQRETAEAPSATLRTRAAAVQVAQLVDATLIATLGQHAADVERALATADYAAAAACAREIVEQTAAAVLAQFSFELVDRDALARTCILAAAATSAAAARPSIALTLQAAATVETPSVTTAATAELLVELTAALTTTPETAATTAAATTTTAIANALELRDAIASARQLELVNVVSAISPLVEAYARDVVRPESPLTLATRESAAEAAQIDATWSRTSRPTLADHAAEASLRDAMPKRASERLAARATSDEKQEAQPTTLSGERAETIERTLAERQRAIDVLNTAECAYDALGIGREFSRQHATAISVTTRDDAARADAAACLREFGDATRTLDAQIEIVDTDAQSSARLAAAHSPASTHAELRATAPTDETTRRTHELRRDDAAERAAATLGERRSVESVTERSETHLKISSTSTSAELDSTSLEPSTAIVETTRSTAARVAVAPHKARELSNEQIETVAQFVRLPAKRDNRSASVESTHRDSMPQRKIAASALNTQAVEAPKSSQPDESVRSLSPTQTTTTITTLEQETFSVRYDEHRAAPTTRLAETTTRIAWATRDDEHAEMLAADSQAERATSPTLHLKPSATEERRLDAFYTIVDADDDAQAATWRETSAERANLRAAAAAQTAVATFNTILPVPQHAFAERIHESTTQMQSMSVEECRRFEMASADLSARFAAGERRADVEHRLETIDWAPGASVELVESGSETNNVEVLLVRAPLTRRSAAAAHIVDLSARLIAQPLHTSHATDTATIADCELFTFATPTPLVERIQHDRRHASVETLRTRAAGDSARVYTATLSRQADENAPTVSALRAQRSHAAVESAYPEAGDRAAGNITQWRTIERDLEVGATHALVASGNALTLRTFAARDESVTLDETWNAPTLQVHARYTQPSEQHEASQKVSRTLNAVVVDTHLDVVEEARGSRAPTEERTLVERRAARHVEVRLRSVEAGDERLSVDVDLGLRDAVAPASARAADAERFLSTVARISAPSFAVEAAGERTSLAAALVRRGDEASERADATRIVARDGSPVAPFVCDASSFARASTHVELVGVPHVRDEASPITRPLPRTAAPLAFGALEYEEDEALLYADLKTRLPHADEARVVRAIRREHEPLLLTTPASSQLTISVAEDWRVNESNERAELLRSVSRDGEPTTLRTRESTEATRQTAYTLERPIAVAADERRLKTPRDGGTIALHTQAAGDALRNIAFALTRSLQHEALRQKLVHRLTEAIAMRLFETTSELANVGATYTQPATMEHAAHRRACAQTHPPLTRTLRESRHVAETTNYDWRKDDATASGGERTIALPAYGGHHKLQTEAADDVRLDVSRELRRDEARDAGEVTIRDANRLPPCVLSTAPSTSRHVAHGEALWRDESAASAERLVRIANAHPRLFKRMREAGDERTLSVIERSRDAAAATADERVMRVPRDGGRHRLRTDAADETTLDVLRELIDTRSRHAQAERCTRVSRDGEPTRLDCLRAGAAERYVAATLARTAAAERARLERRAPTVETLRAAGRFLESEHETLVYNTELRRREARELVETLRRLAQDGGAHSLKTRAAGDELSDRVYTLDKQRDATPAVVEAQRKCARDIEPAWLRTPESREVYTMFGTQLAAGGLRQLAAALTLRAANEAPATKLVARESTSYNQLAAFKYERSPAIGEIATTRIEARKGGSYALRSKTAGDDTIELIRTLEKRRDDAAWAERRTICANEATVAPLQTRASSAVSREIGAAFFRSGDNERHVYTRRARNETAATLAARESTAISETLNARYERDEASDRAETTRAERRYGGRVALGSSAANETSTHTSTNLDAARPRDARAPELTITLVRRAEPLTLRSHAASQHDCTLTAELHAPMPPSPAWSHAEARRPIARRLADAMSQQQQPPPPSISLRANEARDVVESTSYEWRRAAADEKISVVRAEPRNGGSYRLATKAAGVIEHECRAELRNPRPTDARAERTIVIKRAPDTSPTALNTIASSSAAASTSVALQRSSPLAAASVRLRAARTPSDGAPTSVRITESREVEHLTNVHLNRAEAYASAETTAREPRSGGVYAMRAQNAGAAAIDSTCDLRRVPAVATSSTCIATTRYGGGYAFASRSSHEATTDCTLALVPKRLGANEANASTTRSCRRDAEPIATRIGESQHIETTMTVTLASDGRKHDEADEHVRADARFGGGYALNAKAIGAEASGGTTTFDLRRPEATASAESRRRVNAAGESPSPLCIAAAGDSLVVVDARLARVPLAEAAPTYRARECQHARALLNADESHVSTVSLSATEIGAKHACAASAEAMARRAVRECSPISLRTEYARETLIRVDATWSAGDDADARRHASVERSWPIVVVERLDEVTLDAVNKVKLRRHYSNAEKNKEKRYANSLFFPPSTISINRLFVWQFLE